MMRKKIKNQLNKVFILIFLHILTSLYSRDEIQISADKMYPDEQGNKNVAIGNVLIKTEESVIKTDKVESYGDETIDYIECFGNIDLQNQKKGLHVTSERLVYNRKEKRIKFYENVVMEDLENDLIVKGDYLENWEDEDITIIRKGVRIIKEDMICRSELAKYIRNDDRLELTGTPRVFKKGKQEISAYKININLKNDNVLWDGNLKGELAIDPDKKSDDDSDKSSEENELNKAKKISAPSEDGKKIFKEQTSETDKLNSDAKETELNETSLKETKVISTKLPETSSKLSE